MQQSVVTRRLSESDVRQNRIIKGPPDVVPPRFRDSDAFQRLTPPKGKALHEWL